MKDMNPGDPLIFDIARTSFVDGPGVRTTVFFKGCPLSCPWCHNPESQAYGAQEMFFRENCIQCGNCEKNLDEIARFLAKQDVSGCEFVYYHTGSQEKWIRLNQKPSAGLPEKPLSMAENQGWIAYFKNRIQSAG